ncbi:hypothetical protein SLS54_009558 [Diplodia seriata]
MHPLYPVVDETYRDSSRRHALVVSQPVLCTALLTVASRYAWLDGTSASSRAHEIHSLLFKQTQQSIHQSLWGVESDAGRESRILTIIESILLRLLGHAVNLADEISLVEGLSRSREPQPRAPTHVRRRALIRDLLIPLTWEISFRIGRSSFLKLPSPSASTADEYTDESDFSALLSSRADLYRLARLIENSLYSSVSATKDIITADRYPEMVASLVDIMTDWWNKFQRVPGVWSDRVPFGVKMTTLEIQYYNIWTYLHAIFFQAIIERLRGFTTREPSIRHFERTYRPQGLSIAEVLRSERSRRDLQMTEEIARASVQVMERVLDLERAGHLRFIPFSTMTWVFTSATLLMKGTGLRAAVDLGTTDLLKRVAQSLDRSVVDDVHAMSHHTSSLMFLIQKVQAGAATCRTAGRPHVTNNDASTVADGVAPRQPVPDAAAAANLPPMDGVDAANANATAAQQGLLPGSGGLFDPILADVLAEDWGSWLDNMDGSFGFDIFSGAAPGEFPAPW